MKTRVLVTGAGALLGQGIIKSLRLSGTEYHIIAADPDRRGAGLYWADAAYLIPMAKAPDYLETIRRILALERPDAVLIGTDVELMIFAAHREELETEFRTRIVVSSPDVVQIADDKWLTYQFLVRHGLPYPRTALPENAESLVAECGFPLVVKPRVGARSVGVQVVNSVDHLRLALMITENPVIQECVSTPRDEYTSGLLIVDGAAQAVVTMRRDLRDGNTYRAYVQPECVHNSFLADVAGLLGGYGPLNFQFRVADGQPKIFEINARFSGTTPLRAYAGFNEVDYLLRQILFGEHIPSPALREAVILRYWDEIVLQPEQLRALSGDGPVSHPTCEHPFLLDRGAQSENVQALPAGPESGPNNI